MAQARTCRVASAGGLLGVLVVACAVVLLLAGEKPLPSRLLEVDGIELDPHAAAELSGRPAVARLQRPPRRGLPLHGAR